MQLNKSNNKSFVSDIKEILNAARKMVYTSINSAMVQAYWLIGKRIVEEEQNGKDRAEYGKEIVKTLSIELTQEFGKGFSTTNIKNFRKFYLAFGEISIGQTLSDQLSSTLWSQLTWSHFERLIRVENQEARAWYLQEAAQQHWTVRTLDRNIARYSILKGNEQIFATKYKLYLPTEEELRAEIEREKLNLKLQLEKKDD